MTRWPIFLCLALALCAQPAALTNQEVVALAKAGFSEDFIVETIARSHTNFDTSEQALAELSKAGLSERVLSTMKVPPTAPAKAKKQLAPKDSAISQAIATQTPYYEWKSTFFGLTTRKVGVGATAPPSKNPAAGELNEFLRTGK